MRIEAQKLNLIERLMKIRKVETLAYYGELLTKAEILSRNEESLDAIEKGDTISLEEFRKTNKEWLKKNTTK